MAYMKKVTNAVTDVGYGSGWFKISEAGLTNAASMQRSSSINQAVTDAGNHLAQDWATTDLVCSLIISERPRLTRSQIAAAGVQNIPIPACIENGQYLLRAELIALHAGLNTNTLLETVSLTSSNSKC